MAKGLLAKVKSQRGASFSFALLLFLVCVVVSSVVLAASTTSIGRLAEQGASDQRYYNVTSAAQLFQDALDGSVPSGLALEEGEPGTLTYVLDEHREGTRTITRTQSGSTTETFAEDTSATTAQLVKPDVDGIDFLSDATAYALFGVPFDQVDATTALKDLNWGTWLLDARTDATTGLPTSNASTATFTITPSIPNVDTSKASYAVTVDATLNNDWTCDLYFYNDAAEPADTFYLYMKLAAFVNASESTEEATEPTTTVDENTTVNTEKVSQTKTTTITWSVERVVPGRGPLDA